MNPILYRGPSPTDVAPKATHVEATPTITSFHAAAQCLGTIGDPRRLQILWWLGRGERSVTDLCERLAMRQQAVSHHLTILKLRQLVVLTRRGKNNFYRLTAAGREAMALAASIIR